MSVYKKQAVVAEYPAFKVMKREADHNGYVNLTAGETLVKPDHLGTYSISSVASYALKNNECPIEAHNEATANGHETHFIYANGACLSANEQEQETVIEIDFDTVYRFEGKLFQIAPDHFNNLKLVEQ